MQEKEWKNTHKIRRQNDHRFYVVCLQMKLFGSTSRSCWNIIHIIAASISSYIHMSLSHSCHACIPVDVCMYKRIFRSRIKLSTHKDETWIGKNSFFLGFGRNFYLLKTASACYTECNTHRKHISICDYARVCPAVRRVSDECRIMCIARAHFSS